MSDVYLVMSQTQDSSASNAGISCFLIFKDTPGLSFGANENKMGWKVQPTRQVIFDNVVIPEENLVGQVGQGFKMAMTGLDGGRLSVCSLS